MTTNTGLQLTYWICLAVLAYIYAGYPLLAWLRSRSWSRGRGESGSRTADRVGGRGPGISSPTFPTGVVEHVSNVLESVENGHVENVPHVRFGLLSETSSPESGDSDQQVSIVIVAHNEAKTLPNKIRSLLASTDAGRIYEIWVGSDGSTDNTRQVIAELNEPRVRLVEFPVRRGKPSVLNDLVPQCQAGIVLLADARQVFDPECVTRLLAHFRDESVGVVSGELLLRSDGEQTTAGEGIGFYWRYEKFIRRCESGGRGVPGATGACYAIRKSLFQPIPPATILDDVAIPMQAVARGYRCLFEPEARVFDAPSKSTRQEAVRKRRTIAGAAQLVRLFPQWLLPWRNPLWFEYVSHKLLRLASPLLMAMTLGANLSLLEIPLYRVLLIVQAGFYASAGIGWCYQLAGRGSGLFGPPLMFVTLNLTTVAALWDAACARYRVTWQKTG